MQYDITDLKYGWFTQDIYHQAFFYLLKRFGNPYLKFVYLCQNKAYNIMKANAINSRIIKTELIKWRDLKFIQDENFKELFDKGDTKLIESILKYQFCDAFKD